MKYNLQSRLLGLMSIVAVLVLGVSSTSAFGTTSAPPPPPSSNAAAKSSPNSGNGSSSGTTISSSVAYSRNRVDRSVVAVREADSKVSPPKNTSKKAATTVQAVSNAVLTGTPKPVYVAATPQSPPPPQTGNITVITYVNNPKKEGFNNARLSNVKVSVKKINGSNNCQNRKNKAESSSNTSRYLKDKNGNYVKTKDGKRVIVFGSTHYLECNAGDYEVTLIGRKGYSPVKGTETKKVIHLQDDETQTVTFSMNKDKAVKK